MKSPMRLATFVILGALPLVTMAEYRGPSPENPGSQTDSGSWGAKPNATPSRGDMASDSSSMPRQFRRLDKNKDGFIERDEAKRSKDLSANFDQYDTDHDGKISLSEWQAAHGAAGVSGSSRSGRSSSDMGTSSGSYGSGSTSSPDTGGYSTGSGSSGMGGSSSGSSTGQ